MDNNLNVNLKRRNYRLSNYYTKGQMMRLDLKSYEVNHLYRQGFMYYELFMLMLKFKDKYSFCDFVRTYLLKNCWWDWYYD